MSSPDADKLKELLNKKNSGDTDDFEKEALEGFALLDSDEEAMNLKANLDKKMAPLLKKRNSSQPVVYWMAAAMLLMMGLSVYFMLNNGPERDGQKDLAIVTPPEKTTPGTEQSFEAKAAELNSATTEKSSLDEKNLIPPAASPQPAAEKKSVVREQEAEQEDLHVFRMEEQAFGATSPAAPVVVASESGTADREASPSEPSEIARNKADHKKADQNDAEPGRQQVNNAETTEKEIKTLAVKERKEKKQKELDNKDEAAKSALQDGAIAGMSGPSDCLPADKNRELQKDIAEKLTAKKVNFGFVASVTVAAGEVSNVTLIQKDPSLGEVDAGKVISVIRQMKIDCARSKTCHCTLRYTPTEK